MTSNGGSGGDYQAVEANENRRRRINQVVTQRKTALNMYFALSSQLGPYSLNLHTWCLHNLANHLIFIIFIIFFKSILSGPFYSRL